MALKISHLTREYVRVPVEASENGSPVDPTGSSVHLAFMAAGLEPTGPDWVLGSWEAGDWGGAWYARALVGGGAGGTDLAVGSYDVWVRIQDTPEEVVREAGRLVVT